MRIFAGARSVVQWWLLNKADGTQHILGYFGETALVSAHNAQRTSASPAGFRDCVHIRTALPRGILWEFCCVTTILEPGTTAWSCRVVVELLALVPGKTTIV